MTDSFFLLGHFPPVPPPPFAGPPLHAQGIPPPREVQAGQQAQPGQPGPQVQPAEPEEEVQRVRLGQPFQVGNKPGFVVPEDPVIAQQFLAGLNLIITRQKTRIARELQRQLQQLGGAGPGRLNPPRDPAALAAERAALVARAAAESRAVAAGRLVLDLDNNNNNNNPGQPSPAPVRVARRAGAAPAREILVAAQGPAPGAAEPRLQRVLRIQRAPRFPVFPQALNPGLVNPVPVPAPVLVPVPAMPLPYFPQGLLDAQLGGFAFPQPPDRGNGL